MVYQSGLYLHDHCVLKRYGTEKLKLVYFKKGYRQKGFENGKERITGVNEEKLDVNIIRARSKVYEYAICNDWEYFVTLTINSNKYDRTDLGKYYKDLSQYIRDYNKKYNIKLNYIFIPELHKDGKSWHMHGFISGLPPGHLIKNENGYLDWLPYKKKFGYISLDMVRSREGAARYITKYINKALETSIKGLGAHLYYCSKGLKKAVEVKRGTLIESVPFDYENDFVKVAWMSNHAEALSLLD